MKTHPIFYLTAAAFIVACSSTETITKESTKKEDIAQATPVTLVQPTETRQVDDAIDEYEADMSSELKIEEQIYQVLESSAVRPAAKSKIAISDGHPQPRVLDIMYPTDENTEKYADQEISPIKQTLLEPVSTFSTDVDTASYSNARRFLLNGQLPPENSVRVEEFINYFDYQIENSKNADTPIGIQTELMTTPWNEATKLMRVSLQAYHEDIDSLPPLNLVFLLDVSGSMGSEDKLPLMQRSFNLLVQQLRPEDHVSIVVYAGASGVVLEPTSGDDKTTILNAINNLNAGGSTHGSAGIHLAYDLASQNFKKDSINRVILGTDGDFNVGTTDLDSLKSLIEEKRETGVFLNVLGFGTGNYNDQLMEDISNHGNGTAYYIDSFQEARKIFSEQITSTLHTVAKDVKIQIEFNPDQIAEYRLIGYDNRLLNREDFNNDNIDAGEMGAGHSVTALYEVVPTAGKFRFNDPLRYQSEEKSHTSKGSELAFVKVRYKKPDSDKSQLMSIPVSQSDSKKPTEAMLLSTAVAGFAERLRGSQYVDSMPYQDLIGMVNQTMGNDRWGYRQELVQLMKNVDALTTN